MSWALTFKNLILPIFCKRCDMRLLTEENGYFCPTCWEGSPRITRPFCSLCGRPHKGTVGFGTIQNFPCATCRAMKPRSRHTRQIVGAAYYDEAVGEAIRWLKFRGRQQLAGPLAELMADMADRELDTECYDMLVPVPLHPVRQRERGFNQAALLGHELEPVFSNARVEHVLTRQKPTKVQSRLRTPEQRRNNVHGAFAVAGEVKGRTVLLIDDVVTTGGTVRECARMLNKAGAAAVDVLATALATHAPGQADDQA